MPTEAQFNADVAALAASTAYQNDTDAGKLTRIQNLLYTYPQSWWGLFVNFWGRILDAIKKWIKDHLTPYSSKLSAEYYDASGLTLPWGTES